MKCVIVEPGDRSRRWVGGGAAWRPGRRRGSAHRRAGLGEGPAMAFEIIGEVRPVTMLMNAIDDRRPAGPRADEMSVEVTHEDPGHVGSRRAARPLAVRPSAARLLPGGCRAVRPFAGGCGAVR